jgi:hypothetical protein
MQSCRCSHESKDYYYGRTKYGYFPVHGSNYLELSSRKIQNYSHGKQYIFILIKITVFKRVKGLKYKGTSM